MYEVILLNEVGKKFSKIFDSEFKMNKFIQKARYSKKLQILSYGKV
jgi:hypothetical protein